MPLGWPNRITIARIALIIPFVVLLLQYAADAAPWRRQAALAVLSVMAVSDFADGWLARRLGQTTRLGRFLDPAADKLLVLVALSFLCGIGVAFETAAGDARWIRLPVWVTAVVLAKEFGVTIAFAWLYRRSVTRQPEPRFIGKCAAALQIVLVMVMLAAPDLPDAVRDRWLPVLWTGVAVAAMAAMADYLLLGVPRLIRRASP